MTYLGIQFNTLKLEMSVNESKCSELKFELLKWSRKTVATKAELQSILGKLLWVSRAVRYSRCFVLRIIHITVESMTLAILIILGTQLLSGTTVITVITMTQPLPRSTLGKGAENQNGNF